ncbi:MAG: FAD-dependent oxidoreductase [Bacteroidota bacterium]
MHIVILGNGIAGVTAARHVRKLDAEAQITMVSGETREPYARTALMYIYMGTLTQPHTWLYEEDFWAKNRIERVWDHAHGLDTARKVIDLDGGELAYDRLLLATGSVPFIPPWPGHQLEGVQGLYHLGDLERLEAATPQLEHGIVVGGGLIGVELAEMLRVRGKNVTFLVREERYMPLILVEEESALVADAIRQHGVDLRLGTEVERIEGAGCVEAVVASDGDRIETTWVGVGTGVRPNVEWLDGSGVEIDRGVLVDEALQTNVPGVYAAGDCAQLRLPPGAEPPTRPIWYTARLQGATAAFGLVGRPRTYAPGVFFNSAKFFDLEYQTYGHATGEPRAGEANWLVSDGRRSVRIQHRTDASQAVVGVTSLGVRLRQEICSQWIADGVSLDTARRQLELADFDPEFARSLAST